MKIIRTLTLTLYRSSSVLRAAGLSVALAALAGCSGGGAETVPLPPSTPPPVADYNGPPPSTSDVQSFKLNVWDNLKDNNRCGACHGGGAQSPSFVDLNDVNQAYAEANGIVDLTSPGDSLLVSKVAGGHNCWLGSDAACGEILETWIGAWAGDAIAGGGNEIELQAPQLKDVGTSKTFPDDPGLFAGTVYPLLTEYCADCHASDAGTPQQPYFADGDVAAAYEGVKARIDLDSPIDSRLVVRLASEFHNCWDECGSNADEMLAAVDAMAGQIVLTEVDPALVVSKALGLFDGTVASGGNRYDANAIALFEFKTGVGRTAFDTSGVEPAINLNFSGNVDWVGGWGIDIRGGKAQGSTTTSVKLHDQIKATGEYSIEAWVVPGNVTQEEARIISYSAGIDARNFTLGQSQYNYELFNRSSVTDANGAPALATADADEDLQATLQHVVAVFDPTGGRRLFVNGEFSDDLDAAGGGLVTEWNDTFALVLGNEVSGDRPWLGVIRMLAIHNRALTEEQIVQNFEAGVGQRFFLLFSVAELVDVPDSYVMFEVSQFDSYSYLFSTPTFISLDPDADPNGIAIRGMRIGVNGTEADVGQAFIGVDTMIERNTFTPGGQVLSELGTIVGLEKGPDADEFFLSFEQLGSNSNVFVEAVPPAPAAPQDGEPAPAIGVRTFNEINATMALATGVDSTDPAVVATYTTIRQQLPSAENFGGFLASHQVAIAQLAIEYCNSLVDDTSLRADFFPGFDFGAAPSAAFASQASRDQVLDPLYDGIVGANLASQPNRTDVKDELNALIDRLDNCGNSCPADRTETVVKAVCAGALGSAAMLVQ